MEKNGNKWARKEGFFRRLKAITNPGISFCIADLFIFAVFKSTSS